MKEQIFDGSFFLFVLTQFTLYVANGFISLVQILKYGCQLLATTASLGFVVMNLPVFRMRSSSFNSLVETWLSLPASLFPSLCSLFTISPPPCYVASILPLRFYFNISEIIKILQPCPIPLKRI